MSPENGATLWPAAAAFDAVAESYDLLFTETVVGRAQRKQVWARLLAAFPPGSRILELNCGTGEDARFLSRRGRSVVACDASAAMLEVARNHGEGGSYSKVQYLHVANEDLSALAGAAPFQGAFSNFSGLNCVSDLAQVARDLARLVMAGGRVLLCLWGRLCVFEVLWYLVHGEPRKAARRFSGKATARLGGKTIPVFYPTAGEVRRSFSPWFRLRSQRAIGVFVPPSYVEQSIRNCPKLLERLEWLDSLCTVWPIVRNAGDHMLLEFTRCNS
jgi:ubiquinone/menaquinone biosynthesis C-methylase UbiE